MLLKWKKVLVFPLKYNLLDDIFLEVGYTCT